MRTLFNDLRIRECPASIQDLFLRLIQPHDVIPARYDGQEIGLLGVTPEVDGDASVFVLLRRDVIEGVGVVLVNALATTGGLGGAVCIQRNGRVLSRTLVFSKTGLGKGLPYNCIFRSRT